MDAGRMFIVQLRERLQDYGIRRAAVPCLQLPQHKPPPLYCTLPEISFVPLIRYTIFALSLEAETPTTHPETALFGRALNWKVSHQVRHTGVLATANDSYYMFMHNSAPEFCPISRRITQENDL